MNTVYSVWKAINEDNYISVIIVEGSELPPKQEGSSWDYKKIFQAPEKEAAKSFMKREIIDSGALTPEQFSAIYEKG